MIINPRMPTGHVIFCDDIREEIGGKLTYVGVYGSSMVISAVAPVVLPQLCAAVSLRIAPPVEPFSVAVRIFGSERNEVLSEAKAEVGALTIPFEPSPFADEHSVPFFEMFFPLRMQNIVFSQDCAIKVRAFMGDDEIRLGAILASFAKPSVDGASASSD